MPSPPSPPAPPENASPFPINNGSISWTAPASSDYTVAVVEHVFRTSPTRSDTNPTHAKDSTHPLEDYLNPAATAAYLEATHNGYYKAMPELFGTTILGFRGDEPDYSIAGLPWTPDFFDTFQKVKGYDIRPYLGAILLSQGGGRPRPPAAAPAAAAAPQSDPAFIPAGPPTRPAKLTDAELRAKGDYYDVFSQMFRDGFFKPQGVWCAAHGVSYQVHLNHEEMEMDLTRSEGDFLRDMKYVEVPGIDAIWHQIWTDTISDYPRLASSAAHVYGHPQSFTESFAAYRPAPDVTMARYILNEQIVRGINVIETMFYPATSSRGAPQGPRRQPAPLPQRARAGRAGAAARRGGPSALMRDPGWPALMDYSAAQLRHEHGPARRLGRALHPVQLHVAQRLRLRHRVRLHRADARRTPDRLRHHQPGRPRHRPESRPGTLEIHERQPVSHRHPSLARGPLAGRARSAEGLLRKGGGKVLFLGRTPSLISGKTILDARAATPADFAFATVETSAQLPPTPTPPASAPLHLPARSSFRRPSRPR